MNDILYLICGCDITNAGASLISCTQAGARHKTRTQTGSRCASRILAEPSYTQTMSLSSRGLPKQSQTQLSMFCASFSEALGKAFYHFCILFHMSTRCSCASEYFSLAQVNVACFQFSQSKVPYVL